MINHNNSATVSDSQHRRQFQAAVVGKNNQNSIGSVQLRKPTIKHIQQKKLKLPPATNIVCVFLVQLQHHHPLNCGQGSKHRKSTKYWNQQQHKIWREAKQKTNITRIR